MQAPKFWFIVLGSQSPLVSDWCSPERPGGHQLPSAQSSNLEVQCPLVGVTVIMCQRQHQRHNN